MKSTVEQLKDKILSELKELRDSEAVLALEQKYLGRKGELTAFLKKIKDLDPEEKKEIGALANRVKEDIKQSIQEIKQVFEGSGQAGAGVDMTLPGPKKEKGSLHPITLILREAEEYFVSQNFMVLDGPELESDYFNFESLNIPEHHPARDIQDTFYVEGLKSEKTKEESARQAKLVMRTHTSPVQVRAMQKYGAPLRCVVPGRVFRNEATDANHDSNFYQLEGLMIDQNISLANLSAFLKGLLSHLFKQDVKIRIRPGYFPFVEPGLEIDMACTICGGAKCPSCKHSGWLEMLGAGMVHPNVLKYGKIDPDKYSGFAFGIGIDRLAMMLYGIKDTRYFHSGDLRFLRQF